MVATDTTVWPTIGPIDQSIKDLIHLFYTYCDSRAIDAGPRMAQEVITKDAVMKRPLGDLVGSEAISESRSAGWAGISWRKRVMTQAYAHDAACNDLMLLGVLEQGYDNGTEMKADFVARFLVDADSHAAGAPRLKQIQIFAFAAPAAPTA